MFKKVISSKSEIPHGIPYALSTPFVEYYSHINTITNPENDQKKITVNWGAGRDISSTLILFNTTNNYFVGNNYDLLSPDNFDRWNNYTFNVSSLPKIQKYKQIFGYSNSTSLWFLDQRNIETGDFKHYPRKNGTIQGIWLELFGLGVNFASLKAHKSEDTIHISFDWDNFGRQQPQRYYFHLLQVEDLTNRASYPKTLNSLLDEGIDFFFQKAAMQMPMMYSNENNYMTKIISSIKPGGFSVSDDIAYINEYYLLDWSSRFPMDNMADVSIPSHKKYLNAIFAHIRKSNEIDKSTVLDPYGIKLNLRRKKGKTK